MAQEWRFFVDGQAVPGKIIPLASTDSHHILNVLRLADGAPLTVVEKQSGAAFDAQLKIADQSAYAHIIRQREATGSAGIYPASHLLVALPKSDLPEWITEKATELNAASITFFEGDRSVVKLRTAADIQKKQRRLEAVAEAAAKQSKRSILPKVTVTEGLETALHGLPEDTSLYLCTLDPAAAHLKSPTLQRPAKNYALIIGPEGDFSPAELALAARLNAHNVNLGALTLRVETAAICALAQTAFLWQA